MKTVQLSLLLMTTLLVSCGRKEVPSPALPTSKSNQARTEPQPTPVPTSEPAPTSVSPASAPQKPVQFETADCSAMVDAYDSVNNRQSIKMDSNEFHAVVKIDVVSGKVIEAKMTTAVHESDFSPITKGIEFYYNNCAAPVGQSVKFQAVYEFLCSYEKMVPQPTTTYAGGWENFYPTYLANGLSISKSITSSHPYKGDLLQIALEANEKPFNRILSLYDSNGETSEMLYCHSAFE